MTALDYIRQHDPEGKYNLVTKDAAEKLMEVYAAIKVREDREAIYAKRQKVQYMKKDDFISNGVG